jgi:hypothetical protein
VSGLDNVGQARGEIVACGTTTAVRDIAYSFEDLTHRDLLETLPIEQPPFGRLGAMLTTSAWLVPSSARHARSSHQLQQHSKFKQYGHNQRGQRLARAVVPPPRLRAKCVVFSAPLQVRRRGPCWGCFGVAGWEKACESLRG